VDGGGGGSEDEADANVYTLKTTTVKNGFDAKNV
jgi:hypothetical protein